MRATPASAPSTAPSRPPPAPPTRRAVLAGVAAAACLLPRRVLAGEDDGVAVEAAPAPAPPQPPPPPVLDDAAILEGGIVTLAPPGATLTLTELQILDNNRRVHAANGAPPDFPGFVRQGYNVTVVSSEAADFPDGAVPPPTPYTVTPEGLIYEDLAPGEGPTPVDGQEVGFDYIAYNESGARIDSSYIKGRPASVRLGIGGLIPGFELGLRSMRPGGVRRLIVPPALGPPVGPQTFFSAKQCEVFDVTLRTVKSCRRETVAMFSSVVCE